MQITEQDVDRFNAKWVPVPFSGCHIWVAGSNSGGYGSFQINGKPFGAHRFSWHLSNGRIPEGKVVRHRCDVKACVNPMHLELGTRSDNYWDMDRTNTRPAGANHGCAKLTEEQVKQIRASKLSMVELSDQFNVQHHAIWLIIRRKRWTHI